jgi:hypothetical protein
MVWWVEVLILGQLPRQLSSEQHLDLLIENYRSRQLKFLLHSKPSLLGLIVLFHTKKRMQYAMLEMKASHCEQARLNALLQVLDDQVCTFSS